MSDQLASTSLMATEPLLHSSVPLVSILIPCHNAAAFLAATLESALAQTWTNREIILVDDGSTDDSLRIAREFTGRGVRVLTQPNAGAAAARNTAFAASRGSFIQYLDADDLLSPGKIASQVELLRKQESDAVASCAWGRFSSNPAQAEFVDEAVFRDFDPVEFLVLAGETGVMMQPAAWLTPRHLVEKAGPWAAQWRSSPNDDGEFFARVLMASRRIIFCPNGRVFYRSGQLTSLSRARGEESRRAVFFSYESITRNLLTRENSPRTRRACAGYWQRFVHDYFPSPPELIAQAEAEVTTLGETVGRPVLGRKTALLANLLGWRNVARLKFLLGR